MANRRLGTSAFPKLTRTFSFTGEEAYTMVDFLDKEGSRNKYGKSGLVIELLKLYKEAKKAYGEDALFKMRMNIELEKMKADK